MPPAPDRGLTRRPFPIVAGGDAFRPWPRAEQALAALQPMPGPAPPTAARAFADWAWRLLLSPERLAALAQRAAEPFLRYPEHYPDARAAGRERAAEGNGAFASEFWGAWPFDAVLRAYLSNRDWWLAAANGAPGLSRRHERIVSLLIRQWFDMISPANFPATSADAAGAALASGGATLLRGALYFAEDWRRMLLGRPPAGAEEFTPGRNLAATPGKVILRNRLMELIQYTPATARTHPEPVLVIPAWLMKYYILDLAPGESLAEYLVGQGHTVFMISWRNPGRRDCNLSLEDYRVDGLMAALDAVNAVAPGRRVHGAGYCLGGTLLAAAAAAMARDGDERWRTLTLFAAQTDFTEPGDMMLLLGEPEVALLERIMAAVGYLDFRPLVGPLHLLRSDNRFWPGLAETYLLGERRPLTPLQVWNLDATRLPARAHSEYLRLLHLNNDLAEGRYVTGGAPVALADIRVPIFSVAASADHIAPWRSLYGLHRQTRTDFTFLLAGGGHNAGIVSPPGESGRTWRIAEGRDFAVHAGPDEWRAETARQEGSWWPRWQRWLAQHSGEPAAPPPMGASQAGYAPLCDAPGTYIGG